MDNEYDHNLEEMRKKIEREFYKGERNPSELATLTVEVHYNSSNSKLAKRVLEAGREQGGSVVYKYKMK